jgi:hypothetical protein
MRETKNRIDNFIVVTLKGFSGLSLAYPEISDNINTIKNEPIRSLIISQEDSIYANVKGF